MKVKFLSVVLLSFLLFTCRERQRAETSSLAPSASDPFADSLSRDTFFYFWDLADSTNGNQPDRWPSPSFSSIAATGFGLTSYLIGVERGYISRAQAAKRVLLTLKFFTTAPKGNQPAGVTGYKGFFYHFLDSKGQRFKDVELSTVDTGLLMAGMLTCQSYFDQPNETEKSIRELVDVLYKNVEWDWAMNGEKTMSMGWHPDRGFIQARWMGYNEAMILYIMGLASPTHPIPAGSWDAWTSTYQWADYLGQAHVNFGPLFGHQYSHMFVDFKGIQDNYMKAKGLDYFENSRRATLSNREYCRINASGFAGYSDVIWGLTACDGPDNADKANPNISFNGYNARGAAQYYHQDDGTIAPTAAGGSIPFAPKECLTTLRAMKYKEGNKLYSKYGFKDAYNLSIVSKSGEVGWYDKDYLGIDQGPILIQLENYRSGFVWKLMQRNPYIRNGLQKAGFRGGWLEQ